ncbi:MAG: DNA repair protein RecO [Burkholderiales bacterium]|nr:DNA repair protein RecO [Burkholderiales bacterium]
MATSFAGSKQRVEAAPAWLLHSYPYKETSLVIEVFERERGRVALVARGARRPASALRGVLMAFQPLRLSWFGSGELRTLHAAEWQGGVPQLTGLPLICGFYLNELMLKLMAREDPHPELFDVYTAAIRALSAAQGEVEPILRRFELAMLRQLGYGFELERDARGAAVLADVDYVFVSGTGLLPAYAGGSHLGAPIGGRALLAMAQNDYREPRDAQQAKTLMRALLGELLGSTPLHTRNLLRDLHKL